MLLDLATARGREGADARAGPDEREAVRELDLAAVETGAVVVHPAVPERADLALAHSRPDQALDVLHRARCDLVREPHPHDLLLGLDRACGCQQRRRVGGLGERVEPGFRVRRRLADHPVGGLRPEAELDPDAVVVGRELAGEIERPEPGRPRVALVVAVEEPQLARPGRALRVRLRRLEADQHRIALPREDDGVVALHPPEVRQVEDVVGRAGNEHVELLVGHQRAHAVELRVVARPAHAPPGKVCVSETQGPIRRARGRMVTRDRGSLCFRNTSLTRLSRRRG